ncbi:hypothetical protein D9M68_820000 [compost metagenome]
MPGESEGDELIDEQQRDTPGLGDRCRQEGERNEGGRTPGCDPFRRPRRMAAQQALGEENCGERNEACSYDRCGLKDEEICPPAEHPARHQCRQHLQSKEEAAVQRAFRIEATDGADQHKEAAKCC